MNFPDNSFIDGHYIDEKICDDLLKYFKSNKSKWKRGLLGTGLDLEKKDSYDLSIDYNRYDEPFKQYRDGLHICLSNYIKKYSYVNNYEHFNIVDNYNIQYYPPKAGFKVWHFERSAFENRHRILTFMTYLNDVKDGGTEFLYQKLKIPAKKGLTLIWPVDFTHTHKGIVSKTNEKYIVTGWYGYKKSLENYYK